MKGWSEELPSLLRQVGSRDAAVEHKRVNFGVNTYLVSSLNDRDLQFSLPVLVRRDILSEFPYNPRGSDGAVAAVIEWIKQAVRRTSGLHAIAGAKPPCPGAMMQTSNPARSSTPLRRSVAGSGRRIT
jgi:hypothetical protein